MKKNQRVMSNEIFCRDEVEVEFGGVSVLVKRKVEVAASSLCVCFV